MPYSQQHRLQTSDLDTREHLPLDTPAMRGSGAGDGLYDAGSYPLETNDSQYADDQGAAAPDDGGVVYLEDPMDRLRADWFARRTGGRGENDLPDDAARARVAHAIHLTESALIEVSLAGLKPDLIHSYLGVISELHALRDGRARSAPSPRIADRRVARARVDAPSGGEVRDYVFTPRQKAVVELLLTGASTRKIAAALELAEGTVKIHLAAIYRTLGVRSRAEAIAKLK